MSMKVGERVNCLGKNVIGTIAFIGLTEFRQGKWVGVILDQPKGKNDGEVEGKRYFTCPPNHGIFVRQVQLESLEDQSPGPFPVATKDKRRSSGIKPPQQISRSSPQDSLSGSLSSLTESQGSEKQSRASNGAHVEAMTTSTPASDTPSAAVKRELNDMITSTPVVLPSASVSNANADAELASLQAKFQDLDERYQTLKIKRDEDKEKLRQLEKAKIHIDQLSEFKQRSQESLTELQRQLQAARSEKSVVEEAFNSYREEMNDVQETVELLTLDKEMAEERAETLQLELQELREQHEQVSTELELLREELQSGAPSTDGTTSVQYKQLEQQNGKLKEALLKLRDAMNTDKERLQQVTRALEETGKELTAASRERDRLLDENQRLQRDKLELQENVDAALGAEEMVEKLTEKNLDLEEKVIALEEEKAELEQLCDMNDELNENARQTETELREELDMTLANLAEARRKHDQTNESIADYVQTIGKFRDLVTQLQAENQALTLQSQQSGDAGGHSADAAGHARETTPSAIDVDFRSRLLESRQQARTVDLELRRIESDQLRKEVDMLCQFLPESFYFRGQDKGALDVLLLVPRLVNKCRLISTHVRDKYPVVSPLTIEHVYRGAQAEQASFALKCAALLSSQILIYQQFVCALSRCSVELFLKVGTLSEDMAVHEKSLDLVIDLLRRDELDETLSLTPLEKAISYFKHLYEVHLSAEPLDYDSFLTAVAQLTLTVCEAVLLDSSRLKLLLASGQETEDVSVLVRDVEDRATTIRQCVRKIRRRLPEGDSTAAVGKFKLPDQVVADIRKVCDRLIKVSLCLNQWSNNATKVAQVQTVETTPNELEVSTDGLLASKHKEFACEASDAIYGREDQGPFDSLSNSVAAALDVFERCASAMETGEYDTGEGQSNDSTAQALPPVRQRAILIRQQFSAAETIRSEIQLKEGEIASLRRQLKQKSDELSDQGVRVSTLERRLEKLERAADARVAAAQVELDQLRLQLQQKEKDFEETCEALQSDIDALEHEKATLKERMKSVSRKALMSGVAGHQALAGSPDGGASPATGFPSPGGGGDSALLVDQIGALRASLQLSVQENWRLEGKAMKESFLRDLPPLDVSHLKPHPKQEQIVKAQRELDSLQREVYSALFDRCRLVDLSRGGNAAALELRGRQERLDLLRRRVDKMKDVVSKLSIECQRFVIRTPIGAVFPNPVCNRVPKSAGL